MSHHEVLQSARDALLCEGDGAAEALGLGLYRTLVRGRFHTMVRAGFPHARRYVGEATFDGWVARWLTESPPRAREVHRALVEFVDYLLADRIHGVAADVVAYERAMVTAANALAMDAGTTTTVDLGAIATLPTSATVLALRWDIPRWLADAAAEPTARDLTVVVYRDGGDCVRALELGARAAGIVRALAEGVPTLTAAVLAGVATHEGAAGESLEELAALLEDLAARGVMVQRAHTPGG